jgi:hypothetical protein
MSCGGSGLGLIVGSRLYFRFDEAAVETQEMFLGQMDLVERDLGPRGKARADKDGQQPSEGIPPQLADASACAPTPTPVSTANQTFTPTVHEHSIPSGGYINLVELAAFMKEQQTFVQRLQTKERTELEAKIERLVNGKLHEQQIHALQMRIDALHAAHLLSDDERDAIEDAIADASEDDERSAIQQIATLSSKFPADRAFVRQLRRKII